MRNRLLALSSTSLGEKLVERGGCLERSIFRAKCFLNVPVFRNVPAFHRQCRTDDSPLADLPGKRRRPSVDAVRHCDPIGDDANKVRGPFQVPGFRRCGNHTVFGNDSELGQSQPIDRLHRKRIARQLAEGRRAHLVHEDPQCAASQHPLHERRGSCGIFPHTISGNDDHIRNVVPLNYRRKLGIKKGDDGLPRAIVKQVVQQRENFELPLGAVREKGHTAVLKELQRKRLDPVIRIAPLNRLDAVLDDSRVGLQFRERHESRP